MQSQMSHPKKPTRQHDDETGDCLMGASRGQTHTTPATRAQRPRMTAGSIWIIAAAVTTLTLLPAHEKAATTATMMHKKRSHGKSWTVGARFPRKAPRVARQSWCKASWPPPSLPSFLLILCMEGRGEDGCKGGRYKPHLGHGRVVEEASCVSLTVAPPLS